MFNFKRQSGGPAWRWQRVSPQSLSRFRQELIIEICDRLPTQSGEARRAGSLSRACRLALW